MLTKFDTATKARQAITEGVWLAGFAGVTVLGIEGFTAKSFGQGAVILAHIAIAAGYALVVLALWKEWLVLALLGLALPVVHLALNFTIMMMVFDGFVFYFVLNAVRALRALPGLPPEPNMEKEVLPEDPSA